MKVITIEDHQARYINDLLLAQRERVGKAANGMSASSQEYRAKAAEVSRIDLIVLAIKDARSQ